MNKKELKENLSNLFEVKKINGGEDQGGEDRICFKDEVMHNKGTPLNNLYQVVSGAQSDSGLTFNFSYEIADRAVNVIVEALENDQDVFDPEEWITEGVDSQIPVYTNELMQIYVGNSWIVDEATEETGKGDATQNAQSGWYKAISDMVNSLIPKLEELMDDEDTTKE